MGCIPYAAAVDLKAIRVRDGSMKKEHNDSQISVTDRFPPALKLVIAVCQRSRCLACIDTDSVWRSASDDTGIEDVIAWQECT